MQEDAQWTYQPDDEAIATGLEEPTIDEVSWSASEYVVHEKQASWYTGLVVASLAVTAIIYLITRDIMSSIALLVVCFSVVFFAGRKPATKQYLLNERGLQIDGKRYDLAEFKSFSVVLEGAIESIWLKPLTRFKPMLIIYFAPEDGEKIVTVLSYYLPHEERELDAIDRASRRLRF